MAFRFEDFLAPVDPGLVGMCLQASWAWFEPLSGRKPVAMTLFGDVFLIDRENAIYFLDTNFGELERVATSNDAFRVRLQEPTFAGPLLRIELAAQTQTSGMKLEPGQCFAFAISPLLGGPVAAGNIVPLDVRVVLDWLGQLVAGTKSMPVGQQFRMAFPGWPGAKRPMSDGIVTKHKRDRSSLADL